MKHFIVAGAGKGVGLKVAALLAEQHHVISLSRNMTANLEKLDTRFYPIDLARESLDSLNDLPDKIDGLVYCPGSINLKPFNRLSRQDFIDDFEQNVLGAVSLIQKILPNLKRANGASIVLFSTVASTLGMPFHASIATSKAAVEGLAKSLAAELAASHIRVNVIAPSLLDTPLSAFLLNTTEKKEAAAKRHPLQRIGTADEIAHMAAFLLSDNSSWITGQVIGADGGMGSVKT